MLLCGMLLYSRSCFSAVIMVWNSLTYVPMVLMVWNSLTYVPMVHRSHFFSVPSTAWVWLYAGLEIVWICIVFWSVKKELGKPFTCVSRVSLSSGRSA